jgi:hypothetical protein
VYIEWSADSLSLIGVNEIGHGQMLNALNFTPISEFQMNVFPNRILDIVWDSSNSALFVVTSEENLIAHYTGSDCVNCIVESYSLIDFVTSNEIQQIGNNDTVDLSLLNPDATIRANLSTPLVGSVVFGLNGTTNVQADNEPPYEFTNWTPTVGQYILTATPYSGADGTGIAGIPLTINFTVESP